MVKREKTSKNHKIKDKTTDKKSPSIERKSERKILKKSSNSYSSDNRNKLKNLGNREILP